MDETEPLDALSLLEGFSPLDDKRRLTACTNRATEARHPLQALEAAESGAKPGTSGLTVGLEAAALTCAEQRSATTNSANKTITKRKAQHRKVSSNPNRARNERREELVYLRSKVTDLEAQLQELKQGKAAQGRSDPDASSILIARSCEFQQTYYPVWAEIASRQYAERQQAELKNIRLKMIMEGQIKVAKGLEKLLNSKSNKQILRFADDDRKSQKNRPQYVISNHENEAEIFQMLIVGIEKAVLQVDQVFQANGLSNTEEVFQDTFIRNDTCNGMYLEVIGCKIMPFDLHATGNAVWKHVTGMIESMPFRAYYERRPKFIESTDNMIVETYDVELNAKASSAYFRVNKVLRRYVEEDRILISWRNTMDPIEYASQPTSGIRFLEQGYVMVKRPTAAPSNYSVMQTCFHMRPYCYDQTQPEHEFVVGQLSNFFLDTIPSNIYYTHQMIENCLLNQSLVATTTIAHENE